MIDNQDGLEALDVFTLAAATTTERDSLDLAIKFGLLNDTDECTRCGEEVGIHSEKKRNVLKFMYTCRKCNIRTSVASRHVFSNSKLPLGKLLRIIYLSSINTSRNDIHQQTNVSKKTITRINKCINRVLSIFACRSFQRRIGGEGMTVEIDETHLFTHKYHKGRVLVSQSVWLVGGICRETNEIFVEIVTKRNAETLTAIITNWVAKGTTIMTDGWRGYAHVKDYYLHSVVNHQLNFVDPVNPNIHTQRVKRLWRSIKNFLRNKTMQKYKKMNTMSFAYLFNHKNVTNTQKFALICKALSDFYIFTKHQ